MKVLLNKIEGIQEAIEAMFFSKRSWNEDLHNKITEVCDRTLDNHGFIKDTASFSDFQQLNKWIDMVMRMTKNHITIGRFIDFSFIVVGLHRAGQDDWDSHTVRFENRIIRNSTRLAEFGEEKSDFYKEKILTTDEALNILHIQSPDTIGYNGKTYVKTCNGYIEKEFKDNKDVKRGLYMLSIPSNFIFKCNLTQFAHVYKERNSEGNSNPEVKQCAETCLKLVNEKYPIINKDLLFAIKN